MQFLRFVSLITLFVVGQQACNSRKQGDITATDTDTTSTQKSVPNPANILITDRLQTLGLTPDSDWRGINIGDAFTAVAAAEKRESFESDKKHTGYTIDLPDLETADMLYYQTKGTVSAIDIDLFLNSRQSVVQYRNELATYFSGRYGTAKTDHNAVHWTSPEGTTVLLKDVSKGKDFGLKIKMAGAGTKIAL